MREGRSHNMKKQYSLAQLNAIYCVYKDLNPETHIATCVTCGKSIYIEEPEQCYNLYGHYIPRSIEPKLKYHPLNTHCQCQNCNLNETQQVRDSYKKYMVYRYGSNIDNCLRSADKKSDSEYINFYISELLKLSEKFPELLDIVCDENTGEIYSVDTTDSADISNNIEKQFHTYSMTYRQDLDALSKYANASNIEYERL